MGKICRGRIVWLRNVVDSQGNPTEDHRAIILTTEADYEAGKPVKAVYISSQLKYTSADRMVMVPHAKGGHPQTGLRKPSAAICDWCNNNVDEDSIKSYENLIYGKLLNEIMARVAEASTQSGPSV